MALFSNGNRKMRSRPRTAQELGKSPAPQAAATPRKLKRQSAELGREIHRLECLIADAPRLLGQHVGNVFRQQPGGHLQGAW